VVKLDVPGKEQLLMAQPVLIAGEWRSASHTETFQAWAPATGKLLGEPYPVSTWEDCEAALEAAAEAAAALQNLPGDEVARFLEAYAQRIEASAEELVEVAHQETALAASPRLADVELPRTTNQLRLAAAAARDGSWRRPIIDSQTNIRSCFEPLGPVCVFGPNNFPFAFGSVSGGDFAAAIAAGNPVIGKANSSHPGTTHRFAQEALTALQETGLPTGTVQLLYRTAHSDGERLVADPRVGATGYTGSRAAGLKLKMAADRAGKPIYLELSSVNPVVILSGALRERSNEIAQELATSGLMGTGQFCTSPGLVFLLAGAESSHFLDLLAAQYAAAPAGVLLSAGVQESLGENVGRLQKAGAELLTGGQAGNGPGFCYANTVLRMTGDQFLQDPQAAQTEAFGNACLTVIAENVDQLCQLLRHLEGNLTGCVYSDSSGTDDGAYTPVAEMLRTRVGRLLNDKMPTGVAVSPAMNHGGPFPATGHPGFTAVGLPTSILRFAKLTCYDNVRSHRLPPCLRNKNPQAGMWRSVDGTWTRDDVPA
jgi:NADP-dependent aldehyde dehydrogenase